LWFVKLSSMMLNCRVLC